MAIGEYLRVEQTTIEFFESRGWKAVFVDKNDLEKRGTKKGEFMRCSDDGYPEDECWGPAVPGATHGLAAMAPEGSVKERYDFANNLVDKSGYRPAIHGDDVRGLFLGCKVVEVWVNHGLDLEGLPDLSLEELKRINETNQYHSTTLIRPHTALRVIANFEEDSTYVPYGRAMIKDFGYYLSLGLDPNRARYISARIAEAVLPRSNWILGIPR